MSPTLGLDCGLVAPKVLPPVSSLRWYVPLLKAESGRGIDSRRSMLWPAQPPTYLPLEHFQSRSPTSL